MTSNTIKLIQGRTKRLSIKLTHNGEPYELQFGESVRLTIKRSKESKEAVITKFGTEIVIEPKDTLSLIPEDYVYDVVLQRENGDIYTVIPSAEASGLCIIERGVYINE